MTDTDDAIRARIRKLAASGRDREWLVELLHRIEAAQRRIERLERLAREDGRIP